MGFINVAERTISAKLVYYGVGVGGKTTSLQQVHGILCPRNEVQLVSINTEEDSTLLFDFLPINLGQVGGFKIRIQGFTVPGQPKYRRMRKYVLQGADAVVFVVDSQRSRLPENLESLQSLRENLRHNTGTSEDVPIVVQYNKRDLPEVCDEAELDREFRFRPDIVAFPSVATDGQGVFETFVEAASQLVERKVALYGLGRGEVEPHAVAESVRRKLWDICDEVRHARAVVPVAQLPQTAFAVPDAPGPGEGDLLGSATLRDSAPGSAPAAMTALVDDEELTYELRDSAGATAAVSPMHTLTDDELEIELTDSLAALPAPAIEEADHGLLDKTMQSNLELAKRYGDLDEQRLLLEQRVQDLVEAAQRTVHDLNRPLSALRLMLSTIAKGYLGEVNAQVSQAVQNGLLAAQQMERLVRDLLDSSRLEHDGVKLQFAPCDLQQLVDGVVRTLQYELTEKQATVQHDPLPTIQADGWALTKVFTNLIGNAIAYGPPSGGVIRLLVEEQPDLWRIGVQDHGIGIPDADRARLFRRFERGSNTGGISGTGLGLHIVREIVHGHGGTVTFESTVGAGTTFWLLLPKVPVQPPHSPVAETLVRLDR